MTKIEAFKCSFTGDIFESERDAARSEFRALMRQAAGHFPSPPCQSYFDWLIDNLASGIYPAALPGMIQALLYLRDNRELIEMR